MNAAEELIAQGEAKGLRNAIRSVLSARKLSLSELGQARVAACASEAELTMWLQRAATASSEAEVFAGSDET